MKIIRTILAKEMAEILRNRMLVLTSVLPGIAFLLIPLSISFFGTRINSRGSGMSAKQISEIMLRMSPELQGLPEAVLGQVYIFRQFIVFLLIIPVITALTIAVYSIIGEKQTRSLEPLLATPITSGQLLIAKSISSAVPAVGMTWIVFGSYVIILRSFALPQVLSNVLTPITLAMIFLICPIVATLGLSLGVIVSSRANDPRTAQQIGGLIVLPIIAMFTGQLQGFYMLTLPAVLIGAVALAIIDVVVLGIGVALFDRETILVRWK
jgi:ABC-2 type transport system permease protein